MAPPQPRGLFGLPVDVPSVPDIVNPIVAALPPLSPPPPPPVNIPPPPPTHQQNNNNNAGNGNGNGNGNGGGNGNGNGNQQNNTNNNNPPPANASNPPPPSSPPPSQGQQQEQPKPQDQPNPSPTATASGGASSPTSESSSTRETGTHNSSDNDNDRSEDGSTRPLPQNVAVHTSGTSQETLFSTSVSVITNAEGVPISTQTTLQPYTTVGPSGTDNDQLGAAASPPGKQTQPAIIGVLAVVGALLAIIAVLFIVRRRFRRRREARRARWTVPDFSEKDKRNSARSSFATNIDHGFAAVATPQDNPIPTLPQPAAVGPGRTLGEELNDSQYLIVENKGDDYLAQGLPSPITVRPFSPSESYDFPKPPTTTTPRSSKAMSMKAPPVAVKRPFAPALVDELNVQPGELIIITDVFDDGWATGKKEDGSSGLLPLACFELRDQDVDLASYVAKYKK